MPKTVTNYLCVHCSLSFQTREACELHEKQHESGFNLQVHYECSDKYPNHVTLHFEGQGKIQYWALENDKNAQDLLKVKIK